MEPIPFSGSVEEAAERLVAIVEAMPGGRIVRRDGGRLRAELETRVLGFVDDVDFLLDREAGVIRFRSASRTGYWDLGTNRRRMETLRRRFLDAESG